MALQASEAAPTTVRSQWKRSHRTRVAAHVAGADPTVQDATCLLIGIFAAMVITKTMNSRAPARENSMRCDDAVKNAVHISEANGSRSEMGIVLLNSSFSI